MWKKTLDYHNKKIKTLDSKIIIFKLAEWTLFFLHKKNH